MSVPLFPEHLTGILLGVFAALALMLAMSVKYFFRPAIPIGDSIKDPNL